ncbi:MAG: hypothetical protein OEV42_07150 [Deltaproteobacteria bacterium]|nr:hypothetical protein [Deltaproteobacteria bacterium]
MEVRLPSYTGNRRGPYYSPGLQICAMKRLAIYVVNPWRALSQWLAEGWLIRFLIKM